MKCLPVVGRPTTLIRFCTFGPLDFVPFTLRKLMLSYVTLMLTLVSSFYKGHTLCHIYSVTLMLLFVMCPIQVFDNNSPVWDDPTHCLAKIHYKLGVGSPSYPTNPLYGTTLGVGAACKNPESNFTETKGMLSGSCNSTWANLRPQRITRSRV